MVDKNLLPLLGGERQLNEVPFETLTIGMRVRSRCTNWEGTITALIPRIHATRREDNEVEIDWDNGKKSSWWQFQLENVALMP